MASLYRIASNKPYDILFWIYQESGGYLTGAHLPTALKQIKQPIGSYEQLK